MQQKLFVETFLNKPHFFMLMGFVTNPIIHLRKKKERERELNLRYKGNAGLFIIKISFCEKCSAMSGCRTTLRT